MNDLQKKIKDRIQAAHRVLITSHVRPDGDAIGSSLALALALLDAGKQVQVVLSDGLPACFQTPARSGHGLYQGRWRVRPDHQRGLFGLKADRECLGWLPHPQISSLTITLPLKRSGT